MYLYLWMLLKDTLTLTLLFQDKLEGVPLYNHHSHSLNVWNDSIVSYGGLSDQMSTLNQLLVITPNAVSSLLLKLTNTLSISVEL